MAIGVMFDQTTLRGRFNYAVCLNIVPFVKILVFTCGTRANDDVSPASLFGFSLVFTVEQPFISACEVLKIAIFLTLHVIKVEIGHIIILIH